MIDYASLLANALKGVNGNGSTSANTTAEKPHFDIDALSVKDGVGFVASGRYEPAKVEKLDNYRGHKIVSARCIKEALVSNGMPQFNADGTPVLRNRIVVKFGDGYPEARFSAWEGKSKDQVAPERDLDIKNLHFFFAKFYDPNTDRVEVATSQVNGKWEPTLYCLDSEPKARD